MNGARRAVPAQSALINFENNFVANGERDGERESVDGWRTSTDGKGWTERTERAAEGEGKQFRPEISIKAKRRKSAPAVTVNFSSVLHLTAA